MTRPTPALGKSNRKSLRKTSVAVLGAIGLLTAACSSDTSGGATSSADATTGTPTASSTMPSPSMPSPSVESSPEQSTQKAGATASDAAESMPGAAAESSAAGATPSAEPSQASAAASDGPAGTASSAAAQESTAPAATSSKAANSKPASSKPADSTAGGAKAGAKPTAKPKPFTAGKLPEAVGRWQLLSEQDYRAGQEAGNGMDQVLTQIGASFSSKTPIAKQLGDWFVKTQKAALSSTNVDLSIERGLAVEDPAGYRDGSATQLMMVTSVKVGGADKAKMLEIKKQDFAKEAKKDGGRMSTQGKVSCQVTAAGLAHGCLVADGSGWLETELIPNASVTKKDADDMVKALAALAPR